MAGIIVRNKEFEFGFFHSWKPKGKYNLLRFHIYIRIDEEHHKYVKDSFSQPLGINEFATIHFFPSSMYMFRDTLFSARNWEWMTLLPVSNLAGNYYEYIPSHLNFFPYLCYSLRNEIEPWKNYVVDVERMEGRKNIWVFFSSQVQNRIDNEDISNYYFQSPNCVVVTYEDFKQIGTRGEAVHIFNSKGKIENVFSLRGLYLYPVYIVGEVPKEIDTEIYVPKEDYLCVDKEFIRVRNKMAEDIKEFYIACRDERVYPRPEDCKIEVQVYE